MERSGFFDANLVSGTYDRKYVSQDFADYFASFVGNGVFGSQLDELMVVQSDPNAMSVTLKPGRAWINGRWYENDKDMALTIGTANGTYARIDNIVIHWSKNDREIKAEVVEGIPGASPSAPEIRRTDDEFDLKLAEVKIAAGALTITQASITDFRDNAEACGFVKGLIDQITESDYIQMALASQKAAFDTWFANLEYQLSGDVAGNLQNQINDIKEEMPNIFKPDEITITENEEGVASVKNEGITPDKFAGVLPVQNGGTGTSSFSLSDIAIADSFSYNSSSNVLTVNGIDLTEYDFIYTSACDSSYSAPVNNFSYIDLKRKVAKSQQIQSSGQGKVYEGNVTSYTSTQINFDKNMLIKHVDGICIAIKTN